MSQVKMIKYYEKHQTNEYFHNVVRASFIHTDPHFTQNKVLLKINFNRHTLDYTIIFSTTSFPFIL